MPQLLSRDGSCALPVSATHSMSRMFCPDRIVGQVTLIPLGMKWGILSSQKSLDTKPEQQLKRTGYILSQKPIKEDT